MFQGSYDFDVMEGSNGYPKMMSKPSSGEVVNSYEKVKLRRWLVARSSTDGRKQVRHPNRSRRQVARRSSGGYKQVKRPKGCGATFKRWLQASETPKRLPHAVGATFKRWPQASYTPQKLPHARGATLKRWLQASETFQIVLMRTLRGAETALRSRCAQLPNCSARLQNRPARLAHI